MAIPNPAKNEINPKVVAAITAALNAAGLLAPGDRVAGITRKSKQNPWMRSGLVKIMLDRDFTLPE